MTTLKTLLTRHPDLLDANAEMAAKEYARRGDATHDYAFPDAMTDLEAQSGFLLFEKEFCDRPVALFGQDVPSIAHTRIRIFRATGDGKGPMEIGKEIFSARISEKSLTDSILATGRGCSGSPITVTRLGDFLLPEHRPARKRPERVAESHRKRHDADISHALDNIRLLLDTGLTRSNRELREAVGSLSFRARDIANTSFILDRHLEAANKQREDLLTEAAYTALHAGRVVDALSQSVERIGSRADPDWDQVSAAHPMVHRALDPMTKAWRDAIGTLLVAEIERLCATHPKLRGWITDNPAGGPPVAFPSDRGISSAIAWGEDRETTRTWITALARLSNHVFNPHIHEARAFRSPSQGSLQVSRRHGWTGDIHASFPPATSDFFALSMAAAQPDDGLGSEDLRSDTTPLIEVEMTSQDLMTALRGHPEGLPVPCSIRSLCGVWRRAAPRPRAPLVEKISGHEETVGKLPEVQNLVAAIEDLKTLVASKRSGKGWRADVADRLDDIEERFEVAKAGIADHLREGRTMVEAEVEANTRQMLASISRSLPPGFSDILRISDA